MKGRNRQMDERLIYLVRHGETESQGEGRRYIGHTDLALSAEGARQTRCLGRELSEVQLSAICCSDLQRSLNTAQAVAEGRNVSIWTRSDLREVNLGEWEGLTFDEARRRYPQEFHRRGVDITEHRPPGGESFTDCSRRAVAAFADILGSTSGNLLIVGHAGVNRVILCYLLGMPLENLFRICQEYCCLNLIGSSDSGFRLRLLNSVKHWEQAGGIR